MYPISSIQNTDLGMLVREQEFERDDALAAFVDFVQDDLPYEISCVRDDMSSNYDRHLCFR